MTRQEFLDDVTTFDELHSFCIDIGYDLQEDGAYSEEEYNDYIEEDVYDAVRDNSWRETRDWLSSLPDGYDFYLRDGWGEWVGRSYEDIDDLKERVLEYADENDLFDIEDEDVEAIEQIIDILYEKVPKFTRFVLPGGTKLSAQADICRTVARRAERRIIALAQSAQVSATVVAFVNRLSDYFFVLARFLNASAGADEIFWQKD